MTIAVVKFTKDDDGVRVVGDSWHLITNEDATNRKLCTGECFGIGEGNAVFKVKAGKITCPDCIKFIKWIQSIKL